MKKQDWVLIIPILVVALGASIAICSIVYLAMGAVASTGAAGKALTVLVLLGFGGTALAAVNLISVLRMRRHHDAALESAKSTDAITGLNNMHGLHAEGQRLLKEANDVQYMAVDLDVDQFANINILYGYDKGDAVVCEMAKCIQNLCAAGETCGHIGGDHFTLLWKYNSAEEMRGRLDQLLKTIKTTLQHPLHVCIGVYVLESNTEAMEYVIDCARAARASIKGNNMKSIAQYDYNLHQKEITANEMVDHMDNALKNHEFCAYYQPIYDINKQNVVAAEAMVRWVNRDGRFIPTGEFIQLFERNGLILQLDYYVLSEVCRMQDSIRRAGLEPVPIAVNFSHAHLHEREFAANVAKTLEEFHVPRWMINIELTESMMDTDPDLMIQSVKQLNELGIGVSMDDFGSGSSSLSMLKELLVDKVKLDRGFLNSFETDVRGRTIARGLLRMAQQLEIKTVAEGVESIEQLEFVKDAGCDMAQGFYFSAPMPGTMFRDTLEEDQTMNRRWVKKPRAAKIEEE